MSYLFEHRFQTVGGTRSELVTGDGTLLPVDEVVGSVPPGTHTHTEADITDLGAYLTTETDPIFAASAASGIVLGDITSWNAKLEWASVPASASATGTAGQLAYDSSYLYVCTAADTWVRTAITTW